MFNGVYTALVSPFNINGDVDFDALEKIVKRQLNFKVNGLVILGTTSESSTLSEFDKIGIINLVLKTVEKKCKVIVGIASNDTKESCKRITEYEKFDIDGFLFVTPFYNKPTQEGLYQHFEKIASHTAKPILLYNVVSRCGVALGLETILSLSKISNIVGIKECSSDINYLMQLMRDKPPKFSVLCGEDSLLYTYMVSGAVGAISASSNIIAKELKEICRLIDNKLYEEAFALHIKNLELINNLFIETNPIPVKTLLANEGLIDEVFRLPLCKMNESKKAELLATYNKWKI